MTRRVEPGVQDRSRSGALVHDARSSGRGVTLVAYIEGLENPRYAIESSITCRTSEQATEIARVLREAPAVPTAPRDRYILVNSDDARARGLPDAPDTGDDWFWLVYEVDAAGVPVRLVGTDCGEPEDKTLGRDLRWVVEELNRASPT